MVDVHWIGFIWILSRAYGVRAIYVPAAELKHVRHVYLIDYIKAVPSMLALIFRWTEFVSKTKHCKSKYFKTWQRWHCVLCSQIGFERQDVASPKVFEDGSHWTSLDGTKNTNYTHAISFTDFPSPRSKQSVSFCWQSTNWAPKIFINPCHAIWYLMLHLEFPM